MDDRTLLERAAKAAGYDAKWCNHFYEPFRGFEVNGDSWNPLDDDGDTLRLAVKLRMVVAIRPHEVEVFSEESGECLASVHTEGRDPFEACREAITRAAAAMGGE